MNENLDKRELNLDDLDGVSGGDIREAKEYLHEMLLKYGVDSYGKAYQKMTDEEKRKFREIEGR